MMLGVIGSNTGSDVTVGSTAVGIDGSDVGIRVEPEVMGNVGKEVGGDDSLG